MCTHTHTGMHTVRTFCPNFHTPLTCTSENSNLILSLEVKSSKRLKSTCAVTHPITHRHAHSPRRCIPTITVRGTLLRKCCVCICSECVYSPERVIYFSNFPLSSSKRNRTLSTSEHNSPGLRGTGPVVRHVSVSISSLSHYLHFTLSSTRSVCLSPWVLFFVNLNIVSMQVLSVLVRETEGEGERARRWLCVCIRQHEWHFADSNTVDRYGVIWHKSCDNDQKLSLVILACASYTCGWTRMCVCVCDKF